MLFLLYLLQYNSVDCFSNMQINKQVDVFMACVFVG